MNRSIASFICLAGALTSTILACSDDTESPAVTPAGDASTTETGSGDGGGNGGGGCGAALETALLPVDKVSTAEVTVLSESGGAKTIFVDASAGGPAQIASEPRVYLALTSASRVDVSDVAAASSTAWDLALERTTLFTNGGHGGPGEGGSVFLAGKDEASVTAADASGLVTEEFVDDSCTAIPDRSGRGFKTSFDAWYDYDMATNRPSPANGTYLVRGATGKLFKIRILDYYATPDGGTGEASGRFTLRVTPIDG
jgi:hypothetical protein